MIGCLKRWKSHYHNEPSLPMTRVSSYPGYKALSEIRVYRLKQPQQNRKEAKGENRETFFFLMSNHISLSVNLCAVVTNTNRRRGEVRLM